MFSTTPVAPEFKTRSEAALSSPTPPNAPPACDGVTRRPRFCIGPTIFLLCTALILPSAVPVYAGGGPENVLLLVNSNSDSSKAIANLYIEFRKIPPTNVVYLDWKGSLEIGSAAALHDKILTPTIQALDDRRLTMQIDYLVYSSDFPWRVELQLLFPDHKFTGPFDPYASITGATYLLPFILGKDPKAIVAPNVNWYVPGPIAPNESRCTQLAAVPSRGFRSRYVWDENGNKIGDVKKGPALSAEHDAGRYARPRQHGRRGAVVFAPLRRRRWHAPPGTIYFMWNKDVRSATRDKCFTSVAAQINALGVPAKVQQGSVPEGAKDVTGLMVGAADFSLAKSAIVIRPGAICEHLTSAGGILTAGNFQTPLSEFLRHGAAGASGTVAEPYAIQAKFPLPSLQLHYAAAARWPRPFISPSAAPTNYWSWAIRCASPGPRSPKYLWRASRPTTK